MIRYPSTLIFFVILFVGVSLYQIKHFITKKEIELTQIKNKIKSAQSDINILKAELSYLKRPDRIEKIARNKAAKKIYFFPLVVSASRMTSCPLMTMPRRRPRRRKSPSTTPRRKLTTRSTR